MQKTDLKINTMVQNNRVLVTGGGGFIGSHVADVLTQRGYAVTVFDCEPSPYLKSTQKMVIGDILDFKLLQEIVASQDYVFHFAGIADIAACAEAPRDMTAVNISGTVNLLEATVRNKIKKFIFASSAYVYSDRGGFYRISKQACESFIHEYSQKYRLGYIILRFGSLYGSRSPETNGVRRLITGILKNNFYRHPGSAEATREFIHVTDAATIAADCLGNTISDGCYILTGLEKYRMADLAAMIKEILNSDTEITFCEENSNDHYKMTPYKFTFKPGMKIIKNPYIDMGQGLLQLIEEIAFEK